jgi:hypothetical protein
MVGHHDSFPDDLCGVEAAERVLGENFKNRRTEEPKDQRRCKISNPWFLEFGSWFFIK